jgi:hypothetical protein
MSTIDKVCPVVFRDASMRQILAFEHPRRGVHQETGPHFAVTIRTR